MKANAMKSFLLHGAFAGFLAVGVPTAPVFAQSAENVAVVVNDASPASRQIAEYYVRKRGIPESNVFHITASTDDQIERSAYATAIEGPLANALSAAGLQDRILYLVLTKGVPLRVNGTGGLTGTVSSVDSELALLYRRLAGTAVPVQGRIDNPYFLGAKPIAEAKRFTHRDFDIYLVSRLDAFTVPEVFALIDKGFAPTTTGKVVLDQQDKLVDRAGEDWLDQAAVRLTAAGQGERVVIEKSVQGARDISPVLGYYSWGSNDPRNRVRKFGMGFVPGALAATFVSTDARTFTEPPTDWMPSGDWDNRRTYFAGSPQTLVGDLIREGASGVAGHVAEPYLQSTIRPEILFPAYFAGFNLVESFYLAMPHVSWQTVVVGDPLAAPFLTHTLTRAEIEDAPDPDTLLPGLFSRRRVEVVTSQVPGTTPQSAALSLRAEVLVGRGDLNGGAMALEEGIRLTPGVAPAHLQLALVYQRMGRLQDAAARYKQVVDLQPKSAIALNNLADLLSTKLGKPADALPYAQQAYELAPRVPAIQDTLGWIFHQLGNDANAVKLISAAAAGAPGNADIRLHMAIVSAATGANAAAQYELGEALKLNPQLESSEEVKALRARLPKR